MAVPHKCHTAIHYPAERRTERIPLILGIETASSALSVAVVDALTPIASVEIMRANVHDEWLPAAITDTLRFAGIGASRLSAVAVSSGPGSFTGLRIGMAAAKGMALALGVPLITVPTFDAMAHRAARLATQPSFRLATVFDAKREDVYYGIYEINERNPIRIREAAAETAEAVAAALQPGTILLGDGAEKIRSARNGDFTILHGLLPSAHAEDVALAAAAMLERGEKADLDTCEPVYVRAFRTTTPKQLL